MASLASQNIFQITLASASPRRAELLDQIQIKYKLLPVNIDESRHADEQPKEFVRRLALEKAQAGYKKYPHQPALGSDTIVVTEGQILGKPENQKQACNMLQLLSGRTHFVMTAVALCNNEIEKCEINISEVDFIELNNQQIESYWLTGEPIDKAGGYAIQGLAAQFIKNINGSYSGVMGLPLYETSQLLKQFGIDTLPQN